MQKIAEEIKKKTKLVKKSGTIQYAILITIFFSFLYMFQPTLIGLLGQSITSMLMTVINFANGVIMILLRFNTTKSIGELTDGE